MKHQKKHNTKKNTKTERSSQEMPGKIIRYAGQVYTNEGQGTVLEFAAKLTPFATELKSIPGLIVYVGVHGTNTGSFDHNFDDNEINAAKGFLSQYKYCSPIWLRDRIATDNEIIRSLRLGRVLYTWCDSDSKVRGVMGDGMPRQD